MSNYPIGTVYRPVGKDHVCTVVDILRTYNAAGELVRVRYVSEYEFCGQKLRDTDVVGTTIARGCPVHLIRDAAQ